MDVTGVPGVTKVAAGQPCGCRRAGGAGQIPQDLNLPPGAQLRFITREIIVEGADEPAVPGVLDIQA